MAFKQNKKRIASKSKEEVKQQVRAKMQENKKKIADMLLDRLFHDAKDLGKEHWDSGLAQEYALEVMFPWNAVTKWRYTNTNSFTLRLFSMLYGWSDSRFVTYQQVKYKKILSDDGEPLRLKEEEKKNGVILFLPCFKRIGEGEEEENEEQLVAAASAANAEGETEEGKDGEDKKPKPIYKLVGFRSFTVYNAQQFENFPSYDIQKNFAASWKDLSVIEDFVKSSNIKVVHGATDVAAYNVKQDVITMPPKKGMKSSEAYYSTLLHEWFHATGHISRGNRYKKAETSEEYKREYAIEELRSEIFSLLASDMLGFKQKVMDNKLVYIKTWLDTLKDEDKVKIVMSCFEDATKMLEVFACYILNEQPKVPWFPPKSQWVRDENKIRLEVPVVQEEEKEDITKEKEEEELEALNMEFTL